MRAVDAPRKLLQLRRGCLVIARARPHHRIPAAPTRNRGSGRAYVQLAEPRVRTRGETVAAKSRIARRKQMDQRRRPSGSVLASRPTAGLCFARLRPAHGREADAAEASAAVLASGTWL